MIRKFNFQRIKITCNCQNESVVMIDKTDRIQNDCLYVASCNFCNDYRNKDANKLNYENKRQKTFLNDFKAFEHNAKK